MKEGGDGVKLLKYQPKKRRYGSKVDRKHGTREFCETYQSVPVEAKMDGKTTVEITLTERKQA